MHKKSILWLSDRTLKSYVEWKSLTAKYAQNGTKTENAKRWVPFPDELSFAFKSLNKIGSDPIFVNSYGQRTTKRSRSLLWNKFKLQLQITSGCYYNNKGILTPPEGMSDFPVAADLVPYCLRHTFATDLKDALVPDAIRKELLGHADHDVTDGYTHRTDRSLKIAKDLLEKFRLEHKDDFIYHLAK